MSVLALAGGVGGAKLCLGLSRILEPSELSIVVNTGDDETFYGLRVSPDLDTVMYTLAGLSNPETGWGIVGETFAAPRIAGQTWRRYMVRTWRPRLGYAHCENQAARRGRVPVRRNRASKQRPKRPPPHSPDERRPR